MLNFFDESDEMTMDIQVGPDSEVVASSEDEKVDNPISAAKSDPETISVAKCNESYYVDCKDVVKYAKIAESNLMDSLNQIIACNEGMSAQNLSVLIHPNTSSEVKDLMESAGVNMVIDTDEI